MTTVTQRFSGAAGQDQTDRFDLATTGSSGEGMFGSDYFAAGYFASGFFQVTPGTVSVESFGGATTQRLGGDPASTITQRF